MKLNRKWIMVLALVMSMAMATTGTLAYLTDRDSEANVFTMGNVKIDLNEEFDPEDAELIPGLDIEKKPTITNTGKNDAWVWATIAIPSALDSDDASKNVVHFNYSEKSVADGLWKWTDENGEYMVEIGKKIDDTDILYNVYTVLYETPLKPEETTAEPVIYKVYMDPHVDIDPKGDLYHVENGVAEKLDWNVTTDGKPVIYVSAYAIQTEGFVNVQAGYEAYNAQWGDKGAEYGAADEEIDSEIPIFPDVTVTNSEELAEALKNAEEGAIIGLADGEYVIDNAQGKQNITLTGSKNAIIKVQDESGAAYAGGGSDGTGVDYGARGASLTFIGLTINTNEGQYPHFANMNGTYSNCVINGTLALGDTEEQQFTNCEFNISGDRYNIWTWGADKVTFDKCEFNTAGKSILVYNANCDLYVNNCVFNDDESMEQEKAAIETGADYGPKTYNIYVNDTTVNGFAVNSKGISSGSTLWANKNSLTTEYLNVVIDGVDVY